MKKLILFFAFAAYLALFTHDARAQSSHSVTATWTWAPNTGSDPIVNWNLQRATVSGGPYSAVTGCVNLPGSTLTCVDSTVAVSVKYYYVVIGSNGGSTVQSNENSCTVLPFLSGTILLSLSPK